MVVLMLLPAVTGATLPGRDRAEGLDPQPGRRVEVYPSRLGGQVNDQAARLQICQLRLPQNADRTVLTTRS